MLKKIEITHRYFSKKVKILVKVVFKYILDELIRGCESGVILILPSRSS